MQHRQVPRIMHAMAMLSVAYVLDEAQVRPWPLVRACMAPELANSQCEVQVQHDSNKVCRGFGSAQAATTLEATQADCAAGCRLPCCAAPRRWAEQHAHAHALHATHALPPQRQADTAASWTARRKWVRGAKGS